MIPNRPFVLDPTAAPISPQAKPSPALVAQHLWQKTVSAALGSGSGEEGGFWLSPPGPAIDNNLLLLLQQSLDQAVPVQSGPLSLGSNAGYQPLFEAAGARTGLSPALLAAIVGAEAESRNGVWDANSRNPRSSAAGLTQFLDSTWIGEAQRPGTYLNGVAQANGWLTLQGHIAPQARESLLNLRFDPRAAIEAGADYARSNLDELRSRGLIQGDADTQTQARAAYLAHHLGVADAARFLGQGIAPGRAATLLSAQIGGSAAAQRISAAGNATAAHRDWLNDYVSRKIDLTRYT